MSQKLYEGGASKLIDFFTGAKIKLMQSGTCTKVPIFAHGQMCHVGVLNYTQYSINIQHAVLILSG
jgi:hypothetical protein